MQLSQEQLAAIMARIMRENYAQAGVEPPENLEETINAQLAEIISADGADAPPADGGDDDKGEGEGEGEIGGAINAENMETIVKKVCEAMGLKAVVSMPETKASDPTPAQAPAPAASGGAVSGGEKAAKPEVQRKYSNIFLNAASTGNANKASDFKSRIASMSPNERKRAAYGAFGRAVKCIHASKGDIERAAYTAEHKFRDFEMAREFKALSATVPSDGGYLVPEIYSTEIIEMLYPATVIYSLGARRIDMANGNMNIPKIKSGARAMFTGENRAIAKSTPKFENLKLSAKKLTALIPMSNDLLRSTNFSNDVIVGQDVTRQMALGVDYGALFGTGGDFQPLGIFKNKAIQTVDVTALDAMYSSADGAVTAQFPHYLVAVAKKKNINAGNLGFVFNTSVEYYFKSLRDNVGSFIFNEEMSKNETLIGFPYKTTNQIETKDGKTDMAFGNWDDLIIGEQGSLEIETSREATWTDDAGSPVSAFENDQTLIRAIDNVDIGLRHEESFVVAKKVSVPV